MAKRDMINRVLKESASYAPMSGEYKTVLLDNAEAIREDFQQALRRVMEQHHRTTQFVIATRQPVETHRADPLAMFSGSRACADNRRDDRRPRNDL